MKRGSKQTITLADGTEIEPIRIETALSRFPIHNLAKSEPVDIFLQNQGEAIRWFVAPNSTYGHPGPLAYKIDTLVINRRIDEARSFGQAMPQILKLGSLREIAEEIGTGTKREDGTRGDGTKTNDIKRALLQNASAFITAKIQYTLKDKTKKTLDANFTRYQVVLTGEDLPGDRKADAVYIVLNPVFHDVVSNAQARPVDYKYLANLKPLAQRFYELVSPDIYGAVKNKTFTNIRYSEFCMFAPAVRQTEQWLMKKQLSPVLAPHLGSGYISEVYYQPIVDEQGKADWYICLTPGDLAYGQADVFNAKRNTRKAITAGDPQQPTLPIPLPPPNQSRKVQVPIQVHTSDTFEVVALIEALKEQGVNTNDAQRLARESPEECRRQLDYLPYVENPRNRGAFLRSAIEKGFAPPPAYVEAQEKAEAAQHRQAKASDVQVKKNAWEARSAAEAAAVDEVLAQLESSDPDRFAAFCAYVEDEKVSEAKRFVGMSERNKAQMTSRLDKPVKRRELFLQWQAEQEKRTTTLGLRLPADPQDIEQKHIDSATVQLIIAECEACHSQLSAYNLLGAWINYIRREGQKIANPDKSFADFALGKIYTIAV